jgi:4-hydroxybutyrate CoA-transferase
MGWEQAYREKLCTPQEAVKHIKSGDYVVFGHAISEPPALVDAMVENAEAYENVKIAHSHSEGKALYAIPEMKKHFRYEGWFASAGTRKSIEMGYGDYVPVHLHNIAVYAKQKISPVDVYMVMTTPPDDEGYCRVCCSSDWAYAMTEAARTVLVQVNEQAPYVYGENKIHISRMDYITEVSQPVSEYCGSEPDEVAEMIAQHCVDLIGNDSTLQIGIGEIPEAVLKGLVDKKNLGIHSEMISDGVMQLYELGVINNSKKAIDEGCIISTFLMGSKKFYDFCDHNPAIKLMPADYTNHPFVIAQCSNFVSINSCIEIDFLGQVVSDCIGTKQYSGIGGQMDFVTGCDMSFDGKAKSLLAIKSMNIGKDGFPISKITPYLHHGAAVSDTRCDVDYVVTEYGAVRLKGKPTQTRARLLIGIAHPDFRDELATEFEKRFNTTF